MVVIEAMVSVYESFFDIYYCIGLSFFCLIYFTNTRQSVKIVCIGSEHLASLDNSKGSLTLPLQLPTAVSYSLCQTSLITLFLAKYDYSIKYQLFKQSSLILLCGFLPLTCGFKRRKLGLMQKFAPAKELLMSLLPFGECQLVFR